MARIVRKVIITIPAEHEIIVQGPSEEAIKKWAKSEQVYDHAKEIDCYDVNLVPEGAEACVVKTQRGDRDSLASIKVDKFGRDEDHRDEEE